MAGVFSEVSQAVPTDAAPDIVRLANVRFAWPGRGAFTLAVDEFTLPARQRLLLIGPSGSGRSTLSITVP